MDVSKLLPGFLSTFTDFVQILAGGGAGGLIFSPLIRALLSSVGGRWTLRIYALINLVAGLPIACAVPRSRFAPASTADGPERPNTHVSRALGVRPTFLFSAVAAFLQVSDLHADFLAIVNLHPVC